MRVAEEDGRILGYAVLKRDRDLGYIADLLALPNRLDVVRSLVEDALRSFREADVAGVVCWMTSRHPTTASWAATGSSTRGGIRASPSALSPSTPPS